MIIRPFNSDDAKTFFRWYHDSRLSHYFRGFVSGVSLAQCANAPDLLRAHIHVGLDEETFQPIGAITLADTDRILRIYKIGALVEPEIQNRNYARELLTYGTQWSFETMNAHQIFAEILTSDVRICRGMEHARFVNEGSRRQRIFLEGKAQDEVCYSMLREEYFSMKEGVL